MIPTWSLVDRLRKSREAAGLTQQQLAKALGVSRRTLVTYERNDQLKRRVLMAWALATGVPLAWLEQGTEPENGPDGGPDQGLGVSPCNHRIATLLSFPTAA